ncbi:MAG: WD40/YVTN/BNR-like repeat-containing protein [Vicinamibacterales bacterium]
MRQRGWRLGNRVALVGIAAATALGLNAQSRRADADFLRSAYGSYLSMQRSSPYASLNWQWLGPTNISGRATDIAVADHGGTRRIYAGYATSGIWVSDDNGTTWQSKFDNYASASIGDLAVAPSNPDVLWVGTGEANILRASMPGVGVYKSTDGGRTFTHMGLADTQTIARVVVHPTNPETVYVAASGHEWTDNENRGVFKTVDGGRTWKKVFYRSPRTGAIDLAMDPANPNILYAAMWQRIRRKWSDPRVEPGYSEGGIWKTTDGGRSWTEVNAGLPAAQYRGRIGIDISRSNPTVLYAFVDSYEPGTPPRAGERDAYARPILEARIRGAEIYRTDDRGSTWRKVSETNAFMSEHSGTYGWVFGQIRVDPKDDRTIYTLGLGLNVSHDGGKSFSPIRGTHGDHHGLWIDPDSPATLYSANDGGVYLSSDAGATWKFAVAAGGAQFYDVTLDNSTPPWAYGSIQDVGSRRGKIDLGNGRDRITPTEWTMAPGGEGSVHAVDPENPSIVYSHTYYGNFTRDDLSTPAAARRGRRGADEAAAPLAPPPNRPQRSTSIRPRDEDLRAQWMAPILVSPHRAATIYAGYQYVFRSRDRGATWDRISADLTDHDPARMLKRSSSEIPFQTIVALAESPRKPGLLYAGTDDGHLHVTIDDGKRWSEITAALRERKWISRVVPSQHAEGTVYVAQRGREDDDFNAYLYKSVDYGGTFTSIVRNMPAGSVNVIREDSIHPNILYVGTDFGAFVSVDGGRQWQVLGGNLPSVQVSDLQYDARDRMNVLATYGRGMWALDATKIVK